MGLISEFKTFINRGNVMDLAVGVIIGESIEVRWPLPAGEWSTASG